MQVEFPIEPPMKDNGIKQNSYIKNGKTDSEGVPKKIREENIKVIDNSTRVIAGELGLKRPREFDDDGGEFQNDCHILRHLELSAFTRYKIKINAANVTTGITKAQQVIPRKYDDDMAPRELSIQHIHHHYHVHQYHDIDTNQPLSNQNDFRVNDLSAYASHCGSSKIMGGPVEVNNLFGPRALNDMAILVCF
nr:two-component response regulator-like APRR3 isoform X1 [Tanacetum cinerariifolium]